MKLLRVVLSILVVGPGCAFGGEELPPQNLDGVLCRVTQFRSRVDDHIITRCDMVEPFKTFDGSIPAGSMMRVSGFSSPLPELRAFVLHRSSRFGAMTCRGFWEFDTYFDKNWRLRVCPLKGDHVIDNVPCMGTTVSAWREARRRSGTDPAAMFYEDGKLQKCIAARSFGYRGTSYQRWDVVRLGPDGSPQR